MRQHRANDRLQRGNARGEEEQEEHRLDRVGCRWSGKDARALEEFPPGRSSCCVCCGQLGYGSYGRGAQRAAEHAEERAAEGPPADSPRQQTGREWRSDCH